MYGLGQALTIRVLGSFGEVSPCQITEKRDDVGTRYNPCLVGPFGPDKGEIPGSRPLGPGLRDTLAVRGTGSPKVSIQLYAMHIVLQVVIY